MPEMILTFEWDGKTVHKKTKGFKGSSCVKETKFIEEGLGKPGERKTTAEYYIREQQKNQNRNRA
jgi:hypothetical protein